jgi:hypothetical protein
LCSTGRSSERTKFQAEHPTGEEDYSPVLPRLVAVLAARRVATNTSSGVPFAEASYAADFILNQQNLLRMHNRLVKQERSIGMGRMISPQCGIAQPKSGFPIDGTRPSRAVPHRDPRDLRRPRLLGVTSTARARGQVLTAC